MTNYLLSEFKTTYLCSNTIMGYTLHCLSAKIVLTFELHETSKGKREVGPLLWAAGERDVGWHLVILYALCCKLL